MPKQSDDLKEQLLLNRGLKTKTEIEKFLNPKLDDYQKEINIPNIKTARQRIEKAIEKGELIVVFGDYDVDGICASAILYKALTEIGAKVLPYIPHREKEGYGLSKLGLEFARDSGASLVITVDNGIVALEAAKYAGEIGLDLIITDHHLPLDDKPKCLTIVHSTAMCGAAVAWCLIREMIKAEEAKELLQFVAIATVTDLMPLLGVNRVFLVVGLKQLNKTKNLGLLTLIGETGLNLGSIGSFEIGFVLGPRLNAIGRLEHAIDALRLICTKDPVKANKLARLICDTNAARQKLTVDAFEEAKLKVQDSINKKVYILDSPNWVPGIIGLVASRITEEYYRPTIAISVGDGFSKGSARSIDGVNIVEVIRQCSDILVDVGGHKGAAGFSIQNEKIGEFKERMEKLLDNLPSEVERNLEVESEVSVNKLTKSLAKEILEFEPFGFGNPQPLITTPRMKVSDIRTVGQGKHLKFKAEGIDAIAFGMGDLEKILRNGQLVDLAYFLEINKFNGFETLQLKVKDMQFT